MRTSRYFVLRSIPAYAGDPVCADELVGERRVYPRLRGGSVCVIALLQSQQGLSPPTRGIPSAVESLRGFQGSIPAYAGDPPLCYWRRRSVRVYPRLRGGSSPSM